jgi:flagellar hook protein FlgE
MSGAFFVGLSGLTANSMGIKNVGNNLANTNTIGFKFSNLFFEELRTGAATEGASSGQGVAPYSTQEVWTQGNLGQSQVPTDMAIRGSGFFVVSDGGTSQFYTRAGNFLVDSQGRLITQTGHHVMGYPVIDGEIDVNASLTTLDVTPGQVLRARATSELTFITNLNSETPSSSVSPERARFSTSTVIYDSLGTPHTITVTFTRTDLGWDYDMTIPAVNVGGSESDPPASIQAGSLTFDENGHLTSPPANIEDITITGLATGAADLVFKWRLYDETDSSSLLTQYNLESSTSETYQDGNAPGTLSGVLVREDGIIEGLFSNGETSPLGQVVLSSFTNPQGLVPIGSNLFARTSQSGEPTLGAPGTGGRGRLQGNAVEMSNVDMAEEFIKLIMFQRGYQANSRVITTSDQVTLEALQLKQ